MKPQRLGLGAMVAVLAFSALSGCSMDVPEPISSELPGNSSPWPVPTYSWEPSGRWSGLSAKCPMISREIPGLPGIFGEGTADDDYLDIRVGLSAACSWRPNDEEKPALRAVVRIFRNGELRPPEETAYESFERAREEWREGARLKPDYYTMPEDLPGLGEEAYFTLNLASMGFGVKVGSENAIVTLTLSLKNDVTYNLERRREVLRAQRSNAIAAARDVLDDLR